MAAQQRERWTGRTAFIMAAVGSAVGLGNLWRFPYVAFKHGGGAFFIPYFAALLTAGIPLMIVEYAIGQKYQGGAPQALAAVTSKFRWVGWFALLVGFTITTYYVAVMAYAWHYAAASWQVAWTDPAPRHEVITEQGAAELKQTAPQSVRVYIPARDAEHKRRELAAQQKRGEDERVPVWSAQEVEARRQQESQKPEEERLQYVPLSENVDNYFSQVVLGGFRPDYWTKAKSAANEDQPVRGPPPRRDIFSLRTNLVIGALITWLVVFLIIFRGVKNVGRVVMITVPLPVLLLLALLVRGLTLPGATDGLIYYLKPNWELLSDPQVWIAAYGQVFFSLSLGFGILIAYASYMPPESDVTNSAFITSFGNCATSFIAGLTVFSVLGYLAYVQAETVPEVATQSIGLAFVTYPVALAKMPVSMFAVAVLSFLFFVCLLTLGIDSAFSLIEGVSTGFRDRFPAIGRAGMSALLCGLGFCGSLLFCTRSGLMWLDIVDNWMSNYGLPLVGLMECIAVGYFFHIEELKDYINRHSEINVHNWFDAFIKFVTPAVLIYLLAQQVITDLGTTYGGYDGVLTHSVTLGGWGWFLLILCVAMLLSRHYVAMAGVVCAAALSFGFFRYLKASADMETFAVGDLYAPAVVGAVAATILFGGLAVCIYIAVKTHHMAGLSMEEQEPPPEATEAAEEAAEQLD